MFLGIRGRLLTLKVGIKEKIKENNKIRVTLTILLN